jgi:hypothetical protein
MNELKSKAALPLFMSVCTLREHLDGTSYLEYVTLRKESHLCRTRSQVWQFWFMFSKISGMAILIYVQQDLLYGDFDLCSTRSLVWRFWFMFNKISGMAILIYVQQDLLYGDFDLCLTRSLVWRFWLCSTRSQVWRFWFPILCWKCNPVTF